MSRLASLQSDRHSSHKCDNIHVPSGIVTKWQTLEPQVWQHSCPVWHRYKVTDTRATSVTKQLCNTQTESYPCSHGNRTDTYSNTSVALKILKAATRAAFHRLYSYAALVASPYRHQREIIACMSRLARPPPNIYGGRERESILWTKAKRVQRHKACTYEINQSPAANLNGQREDGCRVTWMLGGSIVR